MRFASAIRDASYWLMMKGADAELAVIQLTKLRKQLPALYVLLVINMIAVAYNHYGLAPDAISILIPFVFSAICIVRAIYWARPASAAFTTEQAIVRLRTVVIMSSVLSAVFVIWALTLDHYGGAYEKGHVAFFVAITVIGCIFCLTYLPQAALMVTGLVLAPYLAYYISVGHPVFLAVAVNLSLVVVVMIQVLTINYKAFVDLETSKSALALEQAQSRALSSQNALLANTDSLTGLPNRRAFFTRLDRLIEEAGEANGTFALGVVDLDGFKPINDSLGHAVGDRVLVEISRRLTSIARGEIVAARLGGDEFGILVPGMSRVDVAEQFGRDLCERLSLPLIIDDMHLGFGASCGLAIHTQSGSAAALYDRADYALYDAKASRRGGAVIFAESHDKRLRGERAVEAALSAAELDVEMEVHFQPIIDLVTRRDVAAEALARWNSPLLGRVQPDRFIEVAERTGLIRLLTPVLLRKALAGAALWPEPLSLSFNLSAHDIVSTEIVRDLIATVQASAVAPSRITFEITETAVMRDFDLARSNIMLLREIGLKIALDDFGAGYSSLSCVHRLPLDKIKIDRSFVHDITQQTEGRKVVQTMLDLCGTLGLDCVVEGVETPEQCALIAQLGGRYVQGYHFARPLPLADFIERLQSRLDRIAA